MEIARRPARPAPWRAPGRVGDREEADRRVLGGKPRPQRPDPAGADHRDAEIVVLQLACSSDCVLFELDQRAEEILRVHERDALAVRRCAAACRRRARARPWRRAPAPSRRRCRRRGRNDGCRPSGLRSRNFATGESGRDGSISSILRVAEIDVGEPHALLLVDLRLADAQPVHRLRASAPPPRGRARRSRRG